MATAPYRKILIIDDDKQFQEPLIKYLTLKKFQVNIADSGKVGLQLNDHLQFDLIITDLRMEEMDGLQVIKKFAAIHPHAKIIVISGFVDDDEFKEINDQQVVKAIFSKPVDYEELFSKIDELLK
jgi:DNA-binding NtrC family response regulator